jgi:hypothetical protein
VATCSALTLIPGEIYRQDFEGCAELRLRSGEPIPVVSVADAPASPRVGALVGADGDRRYYTSWLQPIGVTPGETYCLSAWGRSPHVPLSFGLSRMDAGQIDLGRESVLIGPAGLLDPELGAVAPLAPSARWQRAERSFTVPLDTGFVRIFATSSDAGPVSPGTMYPAAAQVDGLRLSRGPCTGAAPACAAADAARGLKGEYFDNVDFTAPKVTRLDPRPGADWGAGSPDPRIEPDTFSVRWTGFVEPRYSETYTFVTRSDDGVRLFVDGAKIIENWTDHAPTENAGTVTLTAECRHRDAHGGSQVCDHARDVRELGCATLQLFWQSASQARELVPRERPFPGADGCVAAGSLLSHWSFDAIEGVSLADATCRAAYGTLRGASGELSPSTGAVGQALSFDGERTWVRVANEDVAQRLAAYGQRTVAARVNLSRTKPGQAVIASRQVAGSVSEHWALSFLDGRLTMSVNSHRPGEAACSTSASPPPAPGSRSPGLTMVGPSGLS